MNLFSVAASYPHASLNMFDHGKSSLWQIRLHRQPMSVASLHTSSCVWEVFYGDVEFLLQIDYWIFQQRRHKLGSKKDPKLSISISLGFLLRTFVVIRMVGRCSWWHLYIYENLQVILVWSKSSHQSSQIFRWFWTRWLGFEISAWA